MCEPVSLSAATAAIASTSATSAAAAGTAATVAGLGTVGVVGAGTAAVGTVAGTSAASLAATLGALSSAALHSLLIGGGIASAVMRAESAKEQDKLSKINARSQANQIGIEISQQAEATAQKNFDLARSALALRGQVNSQDLGNQSVRAMGRAIGFELGQDKAVVQRNLEIAQGEASARLRGVAITRNSEAIKVGDTSALSLGFDIGTTLLENAPRARDAFQSLRIA